MIFNHIKKLNADGKIIGITFSISSLRKRVAGAKTVKILKKQ